MSGVFCHGIDGVLGFTRFVSFICKYVNTTAIAVSAMFFVASRSIPKNVCVIDQSSIAVAEAYCPPKL